MSDEPEVPPATESDVPPTPVAAPPKRHGFGRRHWKGLTLLTVVGVPLVVVALWITTTLAYTYSSGSRAGYNQKLSRKGWICKTWEGELAVASVPGTAPEIWHYSVRSDSVAQAIDALAGQAVKLHYREHATVPTSCFGETNYQVTGVEKVAR